MAFTEESLNFMGFLGNTMGFLWEAHGYNHLGMVKNPVGPTVSCGFELVTMECQQDIFIIHTLYSCFACFMGVLLVISLICI